MGGRLAGTGEVDFAGWLSRGWETIKDDVVTFAVASLLAGLISAVTCVIFLTGPLASCGIMMMAFRKLLYGRVEIGNLFDGLKRFVPAFLAFLIILLASMVIQIVSGGPAWALAAMAGSSPQAAPPPAGAMLAAQLWSWVAGTVLGALLGGATFFVLAHIAARNVGPIEALQASWEIFRRNVVMFTLTAFVYGLITMAGAIACCVGVFVTAPLITAATVHAYIDHFGLQGVNVEE